MIERLCKDCHKNFKQFSLLQTRCNECTVKRERKKKIEKLSKPFKCRNCFIEVVPTRSQVTAKGYAAKFCSHKCHNEWRSNNPPSLKTEKFSLGNKLSREWQKSIRELNHSICQRCFKYDEHIDTHHIAARSQRADLKYDVTNGVCLCRSCHTWVHHHPKEAKELGFISDAKYGIKKKEERDSKAIAALEKYREGKTQ